ncbi:hypothetical protein [Psychrobacillus antarcticus]|nr:hypothetical protein [Psychrobacillus antarcticus]
MLIATTNIGNSEMKIDQQKTHIVKLEMRVNELERQVRLTIRLHN